MKSAILLVGIICAYCGVMGETTDWETRVHEFFAEFSDLWGQGKLEELTKTKFVCDLRTLVPGQEPFKDADGDIALHQEMYDEGYTKMRIDSIEDIFPVGDGHVVVYLKATFLNAKTGGTDSPTKVVFFLVNDWGKLKVKLVINN